MGGIRLGAHTDLMVIGGKNLTADRYTYKRDIIEEHVPFDTFIGDDSVLALGNARSHIARSI